MPGLKTGVENAIFGSQIGSGLGELGGTSPPTIHRSNPPTPPPPLFPLVRQEKYSMLVVLCLAVQTRAT